MQVNHITTIPPDQAKTKKAEACSSDFSQTLQQAMNKGNNQYDDIFQAAGEQYNISPTLLKTIAQAESSLNTNAVSRCGAQGLMQLMPSTARSLGVQNSFNPQDNIFGGARYLRQMLDRFNNNVPLALAAYNAGPGAVEKYRGVPPYSQTIRYINKIMTSNELSIERKTSNTNTNTNTNTNKTIKDSKNITKYLPAKISNKNPEIVSIISDIADTDRQASLIRLLQLLDETKYDGTTF